MDDGELLAWIAGAALSAYCLVLGLRNGTAGSATTRLRSPFWFWASMFFFAVSTAVSSFRAVIELSGI
jgi:hypothetical protein